MLADTRRELDSMSGLASEVAALRDDLTVYLGFRVPNLETAWLGLLYVGVTYPRRGGEEEIRGLTELVCTSRLAEHSR